MILGTRASELARTQTDTVVAMLRERRPDLDIEIKLVRTTGDIVKDRPLSALGGFGAFVKELDNLIVAGEIDGAVNSLKDMPVDLTAGTEISAVLPRAPVEDVLLSDVPLDRLPEGAVVGSSSVRRKMQLLAQRPDLEVRDLRGNVLTRIRKWEEGEYDAIVLARAGLRRLGLPERGFALDPEEFIPAVGQGAIAVVCREGSEHSAVVRELDDIRTRSEVEAERYVLKALGGGCSVPIGIWARREGEDMRIKGVVFSQNGEARAERRIAMNDLKGGLDELARELAVGLEVKG